MNCVSSGGCTTKRCIVLLHDALSGGGAERFTVDLAVELHRRGNNVAVVVTRHPGVWAEELQQKGVAVFSAQRKSRYDIPGWLRCIAMVRELRPCILHANKTWGNFTGVLLAGMLGVPVIVHEHSDPRRDGAVTRILKKVLYARADRIVACDSDTARTLQRLTGIDPKKFVVVPNGIPLERPGSVSAQQVQKMRDNLLGDGALLVGTFARLEPQKSLDLLLDAVHIANKECTTIRYIIAGTGSLAAHLAGRIQRENLTDSVRMLGFRKDARELMDAVDVFVLSSVWEGLPVSLLEAMAARKAVVSTDVGGVKDAITHQANGLLVPPGDARALADAILMLARDPVLRDRLADNARRTAVERFSIERVAELMEELYREVSAVGMSC